MNITRRKFFFFGLAAGVGLLLPDINIYPIETIFKPTQKQIDFLYGGPVTLYGIPYHENNGITNNSYYGISREFNLTQK